MLDWKTWSEAPGFSALLTGTLQRVDGKTKASGQSSVDYPSSGLSCQSAASSPITVLSVNVLITQVACRRTPS